VASTRHARECAGYSSIYKAQFAMHGKKISKNIMPRAWLVQQIAKMLAAMLHFVNCIKVDETK
jgi:hypothetical protein